MQRRLSAILAADVVGYSALMEADEVGTLQRLKLNRSQVFAPCLAAHGGRLFKLMGDGALVEFGSAVAAVQCALAIQAGTAASEPQRPAEERLRYRIGINVGDVILDDTVIFGALVDLAQAEEALAFAREWLPVWLRQDGLRTVMEPMAQLALLLKRHDEAAMAMGRAEWHYQHVGASLTAQETHVFERLKGEIHSALGPEATERLLAQGRSMADEEVAQRVLA